MSGSCFKSVNDGPIPNSPMVPEVLNPINLSSFFTLNASGWISPNKGTFTFLQDINDHVETTENVSLSKNPLDSSFWFQFSKVGCTNPTYTINYGDRVQLITPVFRVVQCGFGTCSSIDPGSGQFGGCATDAWQTFTVESAIGKTGQVCYGDAIRIRQTAGNRCRISAAGANGVQCVDSDTSNSIFNIFPIGGSLYVDPTLYVQQYSENQQNELCKANPWDISCITSSISNFFSRIWLGFVIVAAVIALILIFMLIAYARSAFSGVTLFSSSSTVNTTTASTEKKA